MGPETCEKTCNITNHQGYSIKTTMGYHFTWDIINKSRNKKCFQGVWRKGTPIKLLVGMQIGAATMENSMEFPQKKSKNGTAFGPSDSNAGIIP